MIWLSEILPSNVGQATVIIRAIKVTAPHELSRLREGALATLLSHRQLAFYQTATLVIRNHCESRATVKSSRLPDDKRMRVLVGNFYELCFAHIAPILISTMATMGTDMHCSTRRRCQNPPRLDVKDARPFFAWRRTSSGNRWASPIPKRPEYRYN